MQKEVGSISNGVETAFKDIKNDVGIISSDVKRVEQNVVSGVETAFKNVKSDIGSVITEVENIGKIAYYGGIVFAVLFTYKTLK